MAKSKLIAKLFIYQLIEYILFARFWKKTSEHCPETRVEMANQHRKSQTADVQVKKEKPQRRLFAECGRAYNINESKIEFRFDDLNDRYELNLHVPR